MWSLYYHERAIANQYLFHPIDNSITKTTMTTQSTSSIAATTTSKTAETSGKFDSNYDSSHLS